MHVVVFGSVFFLLAFVVLLLVTLSDMKKGIPADKQSRFRIACLLIVAFALGRQAYCFIDLFVCMAGIGA
jgi:hypothetical protein